MPSNIRHLGAVSIVDITDDLSTDEGGSDLRPQISRLIAEGRRCIILNLAGCPRVDSVGLGELATALVKVRRTGGHLTLLSPTERVQALLRMTRLDGVFTIYRDEQTATGAIQAL